MNHLQTISKVYEAFGKGDIPTILAHLADDVRWEDWADNTGQKSGVPWMKLRKGKAEVAEFFKVVSKMNIRTFDVKSMMAGEHQVAAEILIDAEIPETHGRFQDEEIHLWDFNSEGKITRMRHYTDTAKHMKAAGVLEMA